MINKKIIQDVYSTNEVKTNKVFKGKPVYRKCFDINPITNLNTDLWTTTDLLVSNIDECWLAGGYHKINIGVLPVLFHNYSISGYSVFTYLNTQQSYLRICSKTQVATSGGFVIIEYTKA